MCQIFSETSNHEKGRELIVQCAQDFAVVVNAKMKKTQYWRRTVTKIFIIFVGKCSGKPILTLSNFSNIGFKLIFTCTFHNISIRISYILIA